MDKKYVSQAPASTPRHSSGELITNDLYLAAFLHCVGCALDHLEDNGRRRKSFVFMGERVRELREAYRTGPVRLDMRSFRESLTHIRRLMDGGAEQRSVSHVTESPLQFEPQY